MKTTVELPADLAKKARDLATRRGTTLRALIEQGLRQAIKDDRRLGEFVLRDASVDGDGLQPDFEDRSWAEIRDASYRGRGG